MVREDLYAALFSLLNSQTVSNGGMFVTATRRLDHIDEVDQALMPYVAQNQYTEVPHLDVLEGGATTKITVHWYIYTALDNESTDPSSPQLNVAVDAIEGLIPSLAGARTTFTVKGVTYGLQRGPVQYFEGLLGTKAAAKIEIIVLAPLA